MTTPAQLVQEVARLIERAAIARRDFVAARRRELEEESARAIRLLEGVSGKPDRRSIEEAVRRLEQEARALDERRAELARQRDQALRDAREMLIRACETILRSSSASLLRERFENMKREFASELRRLPGGEPSEAQIREALGGLLAARAEETRAGMRRLAEESARELDELRHRQAGRELQRSREAEIRQQWEQVLGRLREHHPNGTIPLIESITAITSPSTLKRLRTRVFGPLAEDAEIERRHGLGAPDPLDELRARFG